MPEQLVLTPGGFRPQSQVHLIPPGSVLQLADNHVREMDVAGRMIADHGLIAPKPGGQPLMPLNVTRAAAAPEARVPDLGSGWIAYASWTNNSGHPVSLFKTTWVVPPAPATNSGQTVFLFNGIQNSTMIYQPVLQYGSSAAGGGNFWAVASWYADGQGGQAFHSNLVRVNAGDTLVGTMTLTSQSAAGFSYNCSFDGIANTGLPIQNVQELTFCVETLECYGIKSRSDYPTTCRTAMRAIELKVGANEASLTWSPTNAVTDTGQRCVVVSSATPGGEVDLYYSDSVVFANKATLGDTSPRSPAIASVGDRLFLAWKGDGNDNLNVMYSTDGGHSFGHKFTAPESSPVAMALCAHNNAPYVAWKGDGNDNLNVAQVAMSGANITGFTGKVTLGDTSPASPAIASLNGLLYIAWKGDGNDNLNLMYSSDNGHTFGHKFTSPETSPQAPGLCVHNGSLYITWKGDGNDNLNVARVVMSGANIGGFTGKVTLGDTSQLTPSIASAAGRLYIAWKGDGNDNLNVMYSTDNGAHFGHKYVSPETSPQAPGLGVQGNNLLITWKGDGNDNLNVALVQPCS